MEGSHESCGLFVWGIAEKGLFLLGDGKKEWAGIFCVTTPQVLWPMLMIGNPSIHCQPLSSLLISTIQTERAQDLLYQIPSWLVVPK